MIKLKTITPEELKLMKKEYPGLTIYPDWTKEEKEKRKNEIRKEVNEKIEKTRLKKNI